MTELPTPYDDLEHALWFNVMCQCEFCGRTDYFDEFDALAESSPIEWAKAVAPRAHMAGWSTTDSCTLICSDCSAKQLTT